MGVSRAAAFHGRQAGVCQKTWSEGFACRENATRTGGNQIATGGKAGTSGAHPAHKHDGANPICFRPCTYVGQSCGIGCRDFHVAFRCQRTCSEAWFAQLWKSFSPSFHFCAIVTHPLLIGNADLNIYFQSVPLMLHRFLFSFFLFFFSGYGVWPQRRTLHLAYGVRSTFVHTIQ